ncbi:alcohol dehydrogenase catalytic domain-containing protein [Acidianus sp. HS-5]|uniref:alcohol dehydrogenase catalytic domain-containing protein n=1 Tax=Acidianus sp. HS-5 TaxID=2886040 RepID=UPI001F18E856|nr:alcohol dehydrogenase catalytic domain-containing protein [Acidianus sp. HS-5]BDC18156.1 alcohol dehydrogenase [Acidianus sp. HS-5]
MKAAVLDQIGRPLSIKDVKKPEVKGKEILLKVLATGLCHGDLHIIFGEWKDDILVNPPRILGHEIVGEITEDSEHFKKGDKVIVYNAFGCGTCKFCRRGYPQFCEKVKILGVQEDGGFAEYVKVPSEDNLIKIDNEENPIKIAPLADAGVTAYNSVKNIEEDSNVALIGTGSVSMIALQILKSKGVKTTVVGRNSLKLSKALELGADRIIQVKNSYSEDFSAKIGREKFDYIIDYVGSNETLRDIVWALDRMGELRIVGEFGGEMEIWEQLLVLRGLKIKGILYGTKDDMRNTVKLYEEGKIKTLAVPYKLEEINEAIDDLSSERIIGRAVIIP